MSRYSDALWKPVPEFYPGRRGYRVESFVIHSAVGYAAAVYARFTQPPVDASTHFLVLQSGEVWQFVDTGDTAYANGTPNRVGGPDPQVPWLPLYYSIDPVTGIGVPNFVTISVEMEGGPMGNESEPWTEAQYAALVKLTRWVLAEHGLGPAERHVNLLEHNQISATACPSNRNQWDRLIADVNTMEDDMAWTDEDKAYLNDRLAERFGFLTEQVLLPKFAELERRLAELEAGPFPTPETLAKKVIDEMASRLDLG